MPASRSSARRRNTASASNRRKACWARRRTCSSPTTPSSMPAASATRCPRTAAQGRSSGRGGYPEQEPAEVREGAVPAGRPDPQFHPGRRKPARGADPAAGRSREDRPTVGLKKDKLQGGDYFVKVYANEPG